MEKSVLLTGPSFLVGGFRGREKIGAGEGCVGVEGRVGTGEGGCVGADTVVAFAGRVGVWGSGVG